MAIIRSIIRRRAAGEVVRTTHFYNKLAKAWRYGSEVEELIIVDGMTERRAYAREISEIKRRRGLWNSAAGGPVGLEKIAREQWSDPKYRQLQTIARKKSWADDTERKQNAAKRTRAMNKKLWHDKTHRNKRIENIRKARTSDLTRSILTLIKQRPGMTAKEIISVLGNEDAVRASLGHLKKNGAVERRGYMRRARYYSTNVVLLEAV